MPKISIYVPDEMKARMDEADDRANWSAIAQRAFEIELGHLESAQEIGSMTDVIERLRASKEQSAKASQDDGRTAGQEWAKRSAEYEDLKRVAKLNLRDFYENFEDPDWTAREFVTTAIMGSHEEAKFILGDDAEMSACYGVDEDMVDATLTREFLVGFVEGAIEVWEEIKNQI